MIVSVATNGKRAMPTRADIEELKAVESQIGRQVWFALWVMTAGIMTAVALAVLPVLAVQIIAWAVGGVGLILYAVRSIREGRARSDRARAQSLLEESERRARMARRRQ